MSDNLRSFKCIDLPEEVDEDAISQYFSQHGDVEDVKIEIAEDDTLVATVRMGRPEQALAMLEAGSHVISGVTIAMEEMETDDGEDTFMTVVAQGVNASIATFNLKGEDHTLGNTVRYMLNKNPNVEFAGYSIPHPYSNLLKIRVQTKLGEAAVESLKQSLRDLTDMTNHILDTFTQQVDQYQESNMDMS
eukprot:CAMPEP_0168512006 /NCGR_PEP_ID=MMETSP0405-20121227/2505_1 /TAXON_ID=498012 /ORGANISM="Trichosphaerium sp, Strain Am-I-7 wt" /LENGTH=189 /DNA_ID=CAMNT_0008530355 /DNA_START=11 /DNA_END=580 /DNA_ORIENTATION=+